MRYLKKTLKNGLNVIAVPMKDSTTVTVLVMVRAGSKYETRKISGVSHFLEHMCFKGTVKRPSALSVAKELDAVGAEYNAFTGQEYTGYYAKAHPKHLSMVLDVVSDIYLNPIFDEKEIEKEKGVVIEEINMYEDTPSEKVHDTFTTLLYGDQPAGWPVLGTKESVQLLKKSDIERYRASHYVAEATTVVIAGNVDEKEIFKRIAASFGGISAGPKGNKKKIKERQSVPQIALHKKDSEQTHVAIGVRAFPVGDERQYALAVLRSVLAGGMSARLWQKVRDELGVAYYVYAYNGNYTDHGFLAVAAGIDNNRVPEVVDAVMGELRCLANEDVPEDELKKAKDYVLGRMYLKLETSDNLAEFYAEQAVVKGELEKPEDIAKKIRAITAKDIRKVARLIFSNKRLNFALVGRYSNEAELRKLLTFDVQ